MIKYQQLILFILLFLVKRGPLVWLSCLNCPVFLGFPKLDAVTIGNKLCALPIHFKFLLYNVLLHYAVSVCISCRIKNNRDAVAFSC